MTDKITFNNYDTMHPYMVAIEVLKVETDEDGVVYAAQLALILDKKTFEVLYLPTDVIETTADATVRKVLTGIAKLFHNCIAAQVPVIDIQAGTLIETLDINEMRYAGDEFTETVKVPEGTVLH